jgi:hypothetical protein
MSQFFAASFAEMNFITPPSSCLFRVVLLKHFRLETNSLNNLNLLVAQGMQRKVAPNMARLRYYI